MNLYIEGAKVLRDVKQKRSSVKNLVYSSQYDNKKQLLALVCETLRHGSVLLQIINSLHLLKTERLLKNDSWLAQALLYDFTIGKGLVRAGRLKQTMTRHKGEIQKECQRICDEAGVSNLTDLMKDQDQDTCLPRYVRVNLLKTTVERVIARLEPDWEFVVSPATNMKRFRKTVRDLESHQFTRDLHLPDVLVFPPGSDFHDSQLLLSGEIILQDKASCFPAHILNPPEGAIVIDCCAAPGNKTSHLASLMRDHGKIFAFDKDGRRLATLQNLTTTAGVTCITTRCQDFLRVDPNDATYKDVEYILVDPSCSGSGIVSRLNQFTDDADSAATDRLESLARFQILILQQALKFPSVKKVVYSTCSIHAEENEEVMEQVYDKVKDEYEFCNIMPDWPNRGEEGYEHAQSFVRMSPETSLTNGFFIACFERRFQTDFVKIGDICENNQTNVESVEKKSKKHKKSKFENIHVVQNTEELETKKMKAENNKKDEYQETEVNCMADEMDENKKHKKSKHKKKKNKEECNDEETRVISQVNDKIDRKNDDATVQKERKHKHKQK